MCNQRPLRLRRLVIGAALLLVGGALLERALAVNSERKRTPPYAHLLRAALAESSKPR